LPYCLWFSHGGHHVFFIIFRPVGYPPLKVDCWAPWQTVPGSDRLGQHDLAHKKYTRSQGKVPGVLPDRLHYTMESLLFRQIWVPYHRRLPKGRFTRV
jgi:hypothetical protein